MSEGEKRRAEVGEELNETSDSAVEKESSGLQDNIDNESESRQRVTGDLSPQCKRSEPVMDRELEELGTDERKKKRGRP